MQQQSWYHSMQWIVYNYHTFVPFAIWQRSVFLNFFSFSSICSFPFQLLISKQSIGVIFLSCKISFFISCRENRERLQLINNNNSDFAILRLGQNSERVLVASHTIWWIRKYSILLFLGLLSTVIYLWIAKHILIFYQFQRDILETSLLRHSLCQTPSPPETK